MISFNDSHRQLGPLISRIGLALVFLAHAYAKAFVFTFAGTEAFFKANGFPAWTTYPVFLGELLGGIALLAGYRTRWVAFALVPIMLGALRVHLGNGWMFTGAGGGFEYPLFIIGMLLAQALSGAGAYAFDTLPKESPREALT
jgi:putative oxidoreductase